VGVAVVEGEVRHSRVRIVGSPTLTVRQVSVDGEDYGVYAKGTRHRLVIRFKAAETNRTTVTVERALFNRERILWIDKDEVLTTTDQSVEKSVLAAIGRAL